MDAPVADVNVARMVMRHFAALGLPSTASAGGFADHPMVDAQYATVLHATLRAACPKYALDGCIRDVPLSRLASASTLAPDTVLVQ